MRMHLTEYAAHTMLVLVSVVQGDFEWDPRKALLNLAKHGISFDEAATVFADVEAVYLGDPKHDERLWVIGLSAHARVLLVVCTEKGDRTRIISARKAEKHEAKLYSAG